MTAIFKEKELCEQGIKILEQSGGKTVYHISCREGSAKMISFKVFDGIELVYNDFHTSDCFQIAEYQPNIMEINYCRRGRFECELKRNSYVYLGEGDVAVNMLDNQTDCQRFPLAVYKGITILIDVPTAQKALSQVLDGVDVDLHALREKLCSHNRCMVFKAPIAIEHIFQEIYTVDARIQIGYLRLKILELFLILSVLTLPDNLETSRYFSAEQVQKVKHIKKRLTESLNKNITLNELAIEYRISLTALKDCFKAIYGKTIYAFRREYRMHAAAKMLNDTSFSIAEIGGLVGYENPGKFSASFKEIMGVSPGEYRKK
ncbi:AraC family transcriptional regulator [Petroclostridium sp. X23]|uniref:helix-turn-helix domain-containing protein n=1 Tax=Petroclostridium sp. X23 TaxID=3045146 RepID=UPI0024AE6606|nr:AraC family transcriptional regulator [Petroclostridium sp. X23]WHH58702.1 AraC family transcriptional regulator [Petroclostridium sp. X23]